LQDSVNPGFLDECEREALHRIDAIQPFGALLGGRAGDPTVRCASANLADWSGIEAESVLGLPVTSLAPWLAADKAQELADAVTGGGHALAPDASESKLLLAGLCGGPRGRLDGVLARGPESWLLEVQPALPPSLRRQAEQPVPHALYRMPHAPDEWSALCELLTEQLSAASGFERVMVYRFDADGSGEVIAESLAEGLPPYLGLRYPASDIPRIARTLYLRNRHRQIPDAEAAPVPVLYHGKDQPDLTLSDLRAVSPVHVQYLRNMGVVASLSFPVVLNDGLWGLIACHHSSPLVLPVPLRERCADMVQVFTLGVAGYRTTQRLAVLGRSDRAIARLIQDIGALRDTDQPGQRMQYALLDLAGATGAALVESDPFRRGAEEIVTFGATPDERQIRAQLDWLLTETADPVLATDRLPSLLPDARAYADVASGLLAVRVGRFTDGVGRERVFLWWRPEQPHTVRWAGDPRKSALFAGQSDTLSPRSSFTAWVQTTSGQSEPWTDLDLLNAKKFRSQVLRDINANLLRE